MLGHALLGLQIVAGRSHIVWLRVLAAMIPVVLWLLSIVAIGILGWSRAGADEPERRRPVRGWCPLLALLGLLLLAVSVAPDGNSEDGRHAMLSVAGFGLLSLVMIVMLVPQERTSADEYEQVFE